VTLGSQQRKLDNVFCPRCGKPLQPNAAFCMHCGQQVGGLSPQVATSAGQPTEGRRSLSPAKRKWFWPAVAGLFAMICILIGGLAILKAGAQTSGAPLQATAKLPSAPLRVTAATMPPDIRAWLDHLRETEDRKNRLVGDQTATVLVEYTKLQGLGAAAQAADDNGSLDPENFKNPSEREAAKMQDLGPPWRDVIQFFESMPPPPECANLAHTYDSALDEIRGEMGDVAHKVNESQDNPEKAIQSLMSLQGKSTPIDGSLSLADKMVGEICDKYNTARWFSIRSDAGNPLSVGK